MPLSSPFYTSFVHKTTQTCRFWCGIFRTIPEKVLVDIIKSEVDISYDPPHTEEAATIVHCLCCVQRQSFSPQRSSRLLAIPRKCYPSREVEQAHQDLETLHINLSPRTSLEWVYILLGNCGFPSPRLWLPNIVQPNQFLSVPFGCRTVDSRWLHLIVPVLLKCSSHRTLWGQNCTYPLTREFVIYFHRSCMIPASQISI